jgi:hypothetical protein
MAVVAGTMVVPRDVVLNGTPVGAALTCSENDRRRLHAPVRLVLTGFGELWPIAFLSAAAFMSF